MVNSLFDGASTHRTIYPLLDARSDPNVLRRFDDVIEMALPGKIERKRLLEMTLSAIPTSPDINLDSIAEQMDGFSAANVVLIAQRAAKISILSGNKKVCYEHFSKALKESLKF